jgi:peptide/nickel transport system substrate-binding protein
MERGSYWQRRSRGRLPRRALLRGAALGSAGVAGMWLLACGGGDKSTGDNQGGGSPSGGSAAISTPSTSNTTGNLNATLRAGIGSDVGSMDPQSLAGTGGGNWPSYATHFNTPLVIEEKTSVVKPYAAEYQWTDNNAALTLKVKPGITFHNGEPLNAQQIKFNLDRELGRAAYNPKFQSGHAAQFAAVGDLTIVDDMTLKVGLTQPDVILPTKIASTLFLTPMNAVTQGGDTAFAATPVGGGPFKFVSRTPDSEIRSVRYDSYFYGRDQPYAPRLPYIANLVQKVIPEDTARSAALDAGELDLAHNVASDLAKSYAGRSGFKVFYLPSDQPMHLHPNTVVEKDPGNGTPNPWRDVRVRKAANMAIDLDTIIKTILTGKEKLSFGSSSVSFGFPQDLPAKRFKYDPQGAKQLLAQAGYASGFETNFFGPTGRWPNTDAVMQACAGYLAAVGIKANIRMQQYQVTTTELKQHGNYGISFWGMSGGPDAGPNFRYGYHSKGAYTNSYDPAIGLDALIEQSEREFDPDKRKTIVADIISRFYENASWIFLYEPVTAVVATDKIDWPIYASVLSIPEYWNIRIKS